MTLFSTWFAHRKFLKELAQREAEELSDKPWFEPLTSTFRRVYGLSNPHLLSSLHGWVSGLGKGERIYGEISWLGAYELLKLVEVGPRSSILELGSGRSKLLFLAGQAFGARGVGVERLPVFVAKSRELAECLDLEERLSWFCRDLREPLQELAQGGGVIYLCGLTWPVELWEHLLRELSQAPKGTSLVSVGLEVRSEDWFLNKKIELPFSWGESLCYLYSRF